MKKYLLITVSILAILLIWNIFSLYTGVYINFDFTQKPVEYIAYVDSENIYIKENENFEKFIIKGIELNSQYPGYEFSEYHVDEEKYLDWINKISQMGANTIMLSSRLDPDFYNALYKYNKSNENPIYIIQGISVTDYEANNSESIYGELDEILKEARIAVDIIHGNRYIVTSKTFSRGLYSKDVSNWTLGYTITNFAKEETVSYTDNTDVRISQNGYNGKYFYTSENASETECILALIMDEIAEYEKSKYNEQKIMSFLLEMLQAPFEYKENVNTQISKMAYIDMNNIKYKDEFKTGQIVSYNIESSMSDFINLLSESEKQRTAEVIEKTDFSTIFDGFMNYCKNYYNYPVIVGKYGFSTSRIKDRVDSDTITEEMQGNLLMEYFDGFIDAGLSGAIISEWQDNWAIETWNTLQNHESEEEKNWINNQSVNQKYGILSYESENDTVYVDGQISEWNDSDLISDKNGIKLYVKYDYENLYIMATGVREKEDIYIPIDTTHKSGATEYSDEHKISFDREVDFIIKISRNDQSRVLVHDYYDALRAMYEHRISGELQYSNVPKKNTDLFVPIRAILKKSIDPDIDISIMTAEERFLYRMYDVYETGLLVKGNSNPESENYNSLADYYMENDVLEIKISWGLLNFYAPNEMLIHDDYYENYGVEALKIKQMYIGIGEKTDSISLDEFKLKGWGENVKVKERLKKSYYIIKEHWNEE